MRTTGGAREEEKWFPECEDGSDSVWGRLQFEFRDLNLNVFGWSPTGPLLCVRHILRLKYRLRIKMDVLELFEQSSCQLKKNYLNVESIP